MTIDELADRLDHLEMTVVVTRGGCTLKLPKHLKATDAIVRDVLDELRGRRVELVAYFEARHGGHPKRPKGPPTRAEVLVTVAGHAADLHAPRIGWYSCYDMTTGLVSAALSSEVPHHATLVTVIGHDRKPVPIPQPADWPRVVWWELRGSVPPRGWWRPRFPAAWKEPPGWHPPKRYFVWLQSKLKREHRDAYRKRWAEPPVWKDSLPPD